MTILLTDTQGSSKAGKRRDGRTMNEQEKIELIEETIEVDEGTLSPETELDGIEEYDSMSKLSLIVMMDDEFGVKLDSDTIRGFVTVADILALMK